MHAGQELHDQGLEPPNLDDMEKRALKPGKLFSSQTSGLSQERWSFWRQRLATLGPCASSDKLRERAREAVDKMEGLG